MTLTKKYDEGMVRVYDENSRLVGVIRLLDGRWKVAEARFGHMMSFNHIQSAEYWLLAFAIENAE